MSITIVPNGRGNKITALMYAIELHKKTNKKIHIIFTKQYDDIFYDLDRFFFASFKSYIKALSLLFLMAFPF